MSEVKRGPVVTRGGPKAIERADYYELGPGVGVYSWSPGRVDENIPATQVHMHIGSPPGNVGVIRFKGPDTLDAVIDALIEHREHVWGKRQ